MHRVLWCFTKGKFHLLGFTDAVAEQSRNRHKDLTIQILVQRNQKQKNTAKICCLPSSQHWPSQIGKGHREESVCYDQPSSLVLEAVHWKKRKLPYQARLQPFISLSQLMLQSSPKSPVLTGCKLSLVYKTLPRQSVSVHTPKNQATILNPTASTYKTISEWKEQWVCEVTPSRTEANNGKAGEVPPYPNPTPMNMASLYPSAASASALSFQERLHHKNTPTQKFII